MRKTGRTARELRESSGEKKNFAGSDFTIYGTGGIETERFDSDDNPNGKSRCFHSVPHRSTLSTSEDDSLRESDRGPLFKIDNVDRSGNSNFRMETIRQNWALTEDAFSHHTLG
jgi:hypothetical protein